MKEKKIVISFILMIFLFLKIKYSLFLEMLGVGLFLIYLLFLILENFKVVYLMFSLFFILFSQIISITYSSYYRVYTDEIQRTIKGNGSAIFLVLIFILIFELIILKLKNGINVNFNITAKQKKLYFIVSIILIFILYLGFIINGFPIFKGWSRFYYYKVVLEKGTINNLVKKISVIGYIYICFLLGILECNKSKINRVIFIILLIGLFIQGEKLGGFINGIYYYYLPKILSLKQTKIDKKKLFKIISTLIILNYILFNCIKLNYRMVQNKYTKNIPIENKINERIAQQGQIWWIIQDEIPIFYLNLEGIKKSTPGYQQLMNKYGNKKIIHDFKKTGTTFTGFFPAVYVYYFGMLGSIVIILILTFFSILWFKFFLIQVSKKNNNLLNNYLLIMSNSLFFYFLGAVDYSKIVPFTRNIAMIFLLSLIYTSKKKRRKNEGNHISWRIRNKTLSSN